MKGKHKIRYIVNEPERMVIAVVNKNDIEGEFVVCEDEYLDDFVRLLQGKCTTGNCFKAIAKCDPRDTFDEKVGMKIARLKLFRQVYRYKEKLLTKTFNRLRKELGTVLVEMSHNDECYSDAVHKLEKLSK